MDHIMLLEKIPNRKSFGPNIGFRIKFVWCFTAAITGIIGVFVSLLAQDWHFMLVVGGLSCLVGLLASAVELLA